MDEMEFKEILAFGREQRGVEFKRGGSRKALMGVKMNSTSIATNTIQNVTFNTNTIIGAKINPAINPQ